MSVYPFAMNSSLLIGCLWYTFYGMKANGSCLFKLGMILQVIILLILPSLASIGGNVAYWSIFVTLFIFGFISGGVQTLAYSYNSRLPDRYIAIFTTSQGLSGLAANLLRLLTLSIWSSDDVEGVDEEIGAP